MTPGVDPLLPSAGLRTGCAKAGGGVRLVFRDTAGQMQTREFFGVAESEALRRAADQGWQVLTVSPIGRATGSRRQDRARFPLLLFSQQLLALLESGLTLTEALGTLIAKEQTPRTRQVLQEISDSLARGENFSLVLARSPDIFPAVYVATVRAAERTGDLPQALGRYIAYQQQFEDIRKKLISAAIYPVMLLAVGGFVTLFLLGYVVPRFSAVYESAGREVPWLSSILLTLGRQIHAHWPIAFLVVFLVVGGLIGVASSANLRRKLLERVLTLPWLAPRVAEFRLARFYRALSLLLASGIALPQAMGMVAGLLGRGQKTALAEARRAVEEGLSLSHSLVTHRLATPVAESLIRVGERSGQLTAMLERGARFHDDEFARWIDWTSRLLEPVLMVAIGAVIGTVVVLLYVPIFELAGSL